MFCRNTQRRRLLAAWALAFSVSAVTAADEPTPAKRPRPAQAPTTPVAGRPSATPAGPPTDTEQKTTDPTVASPPPAVPPTADGLDFADRPLERLRQRYPDGSIMIEREVARERDGSYLQHGSWKMWDKHGVLVASGQCRENQFYGTWQRVHQITDSATFRVEPYSLFAGPFVSEATFEDGLLHGKWTIRDAQGNPISEIEFADGHRHGLATWWYPGGKKMEQIAFRNGTVDGTAKHWKKSGELDHEEQFVNGRLLQTLPHFDAENRIQAEASYLHPQLIMQASDDWWNARLAQFTALRSADPKNEKQLHGPAVTWYPNGQKKSEFQYEYGNMQGVQNWWYDDGQLATHGTFEFGKPNGTWTWYHRNGQKAVSGQYQSGEVVGDWLWWSYDGQIVRKGVGEPPAISLLDGPPRR